MPDLAWIAIGIFILVAVGALWATVALWRSLDSPRGERAMRTRMQGPFVPLSREDIEADRKTRR